MTHRMILSALALVLLMAGAQAQTPPLLLMDLPETGTMGAAVKASYTALQPDYDIWWLKVHEPASREQTPRAVVLQSGGSLLKQAQMDLQNYLRSGGGVVYVAQTSSREVEEATGALQKLGVRLAGVKAERNPIKFLTHPVTDGVKALPAQSLPYAFMADHLEPIAMHGTRIVGMAGMVGSGRLVVLFSPLLAVSREERAADSPQAKLLTQAARWAAGNGSALPGTGFGPGTALDIPPATREVAGSIIIDLSADAAWQDINAALLTQLKATGLPLQTLRYEAGKQTWATVLPGGPALAVLASHREFEPDEMAALSTYVSGGGSLLAVGHGDRKSVSLIAALNSVLGEFGISFTLGRPAGQGLLRPHPITEGLARPGQIAPGGAAWALADWPLVVVDDAAVAAAHEFRNGRIVVLDGAALLPETTKQPNSQAWFGGLLRNAVRWLTGK